MKIITNTILTAALALAVPMGLGSAAQAAGASSGHVENVDFSFDGPFGGYDVNQLQRGLQIYTEVCAACHGLSMYRSAHWRTTVAHTCQKIRCASTRQNLKCSIQSWTISAMRAGRIISPVRHWKTPLTCH